MSPMSFPSPVPGNTEQGFVANFNQFQSNGPSGEQANPHYFPAYGAPPGPPPFPPGGDYHGTRGFPGEEYHQGHSGQHGHQRAQGPANSYGQYMPPPGPPPPSYGNYPNKYEYETQNFQGYGGQSQGLGTRSQGYGGQNQGYGYGSQGYHAPPRPPTNQQNYGPQVQVAGNQNWQPHFQYSQCTGKKKALCIGINYFGQKNELRGCINDARNMQAFICKNFAYKPEDIVLLTDDATNPRQIPTNENIRDAMQWLVRGAQPNDSLFFHYSGHGGQTKDLDGDEADGFDEVIYPVDFQQKGHIVDDDMHTIMVKPLAMGCRLTAIFDSCHSGSALDLPFIYSTEGKIKEPNLVAEAGQGLLSAATSYARGDMGGVFKSAMGIVKTVTGSSQNAEKHTRATRTSAADVISWSGCKDSQTSADANEAGSATGAMSYAFMSALNMNLQQSYQELLVNIRDILRSKYSQKPQLSSSHPMDTNIMFIA